MTPRRKKKTVQDIQEIEMEIEGKPEKVYTVSDAIIYLGVSPAAGIDILDKNHITRYELAYGNKKYIKKSDLDELKRPRKAE